LTFHSVFWRQRQWDSLGKFEKTDTWNTPKQYSAEDKIRMVLDDAEDPNIRFGRLIECLRTCDSCCAARYMNVVVGLAAVICVL
jgi:hypothetical protein